MTEYDTADNQTSDCIDHTDPETLRRLYWGEGLTLSEITERSEVASESTIRHHMNRHGIDRRSHTQTNRVERATLSVEGSGHMTWYCSWGDKQESVKVHRLLAVCEWGYGSVEGKHVHHDNEIPWDNRVENISLMKPTEHHRHHSTGEKHSQSKLTDEDVRKILSELESGDKTQTEIATEFGVSDATVSHIKNGQGWNHIDR